MSYPNGRPATTDAQRMFLEARQQLHLDQPDAMAAHFPDGYFVAPHQQ